MIAEITNSLVAQNDAISAQIEAARDYDELNKAEWLVRFVADLFHDAGYGYKVKELKTRLTRKANRLIAGEREYLVLFPRKNDRHRSQTLREIENLEQLISSVS